MLPEGRPSRDGAKPFRHAAEKGSVFTTLVVNSQLTPDGVVKAFLYAEGHSILIADSAQNALDMTRQFQPDLILLDNEMEGVKGLALLPQLLFAQVSAAVVIMAFRASVLEAVEAIKLGAVEYIERPVDPKRLKRVIDIQKSLFKH
jgi:DNA-binding NtrC family response regulator